MAGESLSHLKVLSTTLVTENPFLKIKVVQMLAALEEILRTQGLILKIPRNMF